MTHRLLLIDDEAPKVISNVFKLFEKDRGYIFDFQPGVSGIPYALPRKSVETTKKVRLALILC